MRRKLAVLVVLIAMFTSILGGIASASPLFQLPTLDPPSPRTWKDCITGHC